jgi:hypothetical protein
MDKPPTPEELRREYLVRQEIQDVRREAKRKRFVKRWIWVSAAIGLAASVNNYLGVTYACIAHFIFSGFAGYVLLRFKRGHLTGMALVGLGNEVIAVLAGFFNPFGVLGFCIAGAFIGMGLRLEEDLQ